MENREDVPEIPRLRHHVFMFAVYLLASLVLLGAAILLHHKAFTPPAPAGQASVLVFTQDPKAKITLQADVNPNKPSDDTLSINPQGPSVAPWLLVVQCPQSSSPPLGQSWLYSELVQSTQVAAAPVSVRAGSGVARGLKLGCFPRDAKGASIANVTLPALETDPAMATAQAIPRVVFAGTASPSGPISVLEIFPGCPSPTNNQATSTPPATPSPTPTKSATPANSPSGVAPASGACSKPAYTGPMLTPYFVPTYVQTREVLTNVNLTGYQTQSAFPIPEISRAPNSDEQYTWNGLSSLSPSLLVANVTGVQDVSKWSFDSGVLYGVLAATGIGCLEKLWCIYLEWQKKRHKEGKRPVTWRLREVLELRGGVPSAIRERTRRPRATRYLSSESGPDQRTPSDR